MALLFVNTASAQLLKEKEFYPGIKTVKGKYSKGYRSIKKLDTLGRTIEREGYWKRKLLGRDNYVYNSNNDQLYYIVTFDFNNPNEIDVIVRYEYKYQDDRIVYEKRVYSDNDSTVMKLIENQGDSILIYQEKLYRFRPQTNTTDIYEYRYTIKYQNDLVVLLERLNVDKNEKRITYYEYFPDGMLKRRKTERTPDPVWEPVDDMFYEYEFDKLGRVKTYYYIVGGQKHRGATYKYYKK